MATDSHGMGIPLPPDSTKVHQFPGVTRLAMERVAEILAGGITPELSAVIAAATANAQAEVAASAEDAIATVENSVAEAVAAALNGLETGGTNPDDVGFDLVLLLGQSNAQGAAIDGDKVNVDITDSRVFQFGATAAAPRPYAGKISLASDPLINRYTQTGPDTFGPGLTFARWYAASVPTNRRVLLVPASYSGTGFGRITHGTEVDLTWRTDPLPGSLSLYESAIAQTQAALAAAGPNSRVVAAVWVQGESDEGQTPANYQMWLDALIAGLRTRLAAPKLPFLIGSMVPEGLVGNAGRTAIDAVHKATPGRMHYTAFAPGTAGQFIDSGLHYNAEGQRQQGRKLFDALAAARANTPPAPAQVTGLGYALPGSTYVPLTWTAAANATGYRVEYKPDAAATWLDGPTTAGTSATVAGLATATAYDFRVVATNLTDDAAPSAVVTVSTFAAGSLLADLAAAPAMAYSLRQLHAGYTGPAIRVRRTSDSAETDIGFIGADLDTAALLTFAGAGQAYIAKWYDQSGNGRHLTQATTLAQARIANASAVDMANGKPLAIFNTNTYYSGPYAGMYAAGAATVAVVQRGPATANGRLVGEASSAVLTQQYAPVMANATTAANLSQRIVNDAGTSIAADTATAPAFSSALGQITVTDTGAVFQKRSNGAPAGDVAYTRAGAVTLDRFTIGCLDRSNGVQAFAGVSVSEVIIWRTALTTADLSKVEANEKAFFTTP